MYTIGAKFFDVRTIKYLTSYSYPAHCNVWEDIPKLAMDLEEAESVAKYIDRTGIETLFIVGVVLVPQPDNLKEV